MKNCFSLINAFEQASLIAVSTTGEVVFVNESWKRMFGNPQVLQTELLFKKLETRGQRLIWINKGKRIQLLESRHEVDGVSYTLYLAKESEHGVATEAYEQAKEMTALLVHRFRSPLTAAVGYLGLISPELNADNLTEIKDASRHSLQEITQMLNDMNQLVQEEPVFKSSLELNAFVTHWVQDGANPAKHVQIVPSSNLVEVKTDAQRLRFILNALLNNALEARELGDEPIEILVLPSAIEVKSYTQAIPKAIEQKMFMPFYTTKARHLGLGLTMSSWYARQMNAGLELVSNSAIEGVCFRVGL